MPVDKIISLSLDGELRFDHETRAVAADDFGHIVHRTPRGVLFPASDQDIVTTVRWAGESGYKVAAQGQRHSVYGRSQVDSGIVIDMTQLRTIHNINGDRIVIDAGAKRSQVLTASLPQGLAPPVLTDYLELSVGGTLAVGGVGGTTGWYGMQSDNVLEMEIVTGSGDKLSCSPSRNADLFHAVCAGLGQVGIITRVTVKLVRAPQRVRRFLLFYSDLRTMLTDERVLAADDRFDAVQGAILPATNGWMFRLDAVKGFSQEVPKDNVLLAGLHDERSKVQLSTLPYLEYLNRLAMLEQTLRTNGQWFFPHPWLTTFVGDSMVESVVSSELARLTPADLGSFGQVVLSALRREAVTSPLLQLPSDSLCYAFNLVRLPTTGGVAESAPLVAANRAAYERVCTAGGTLYPVSAFPMSGDGWRKHFGPAFERLSNAKRTFDPTHVLAPGYEIF